MINAPLVSVIVPSYNHAKYITQAIESIIHQTYKNIQLIVIDDGSSDDSIKIINELQKKYNFEFYPQMNSGVSATLNRGVRDFAKGKYIAFLSSDDYSELNRIEKEVVFMENNSQFGMIYARIYKVVDDGCTSAVEPFDYVKNYKSGNIFDSLLKSNFIPGMTVMIRKNVFDKVGLYNEKICIEDYDMWLRIARYYQIGFLNERLVYYRFHSNNFHYNFKKMILAEYKMIAWWQDRPEYPKILFYYLIRTASSFLYNNKARSRKFLMLSFKVNYKLCLRTKTFYNLIIRYLLPKKIIDVIKQTKVWICR